MPRLTTTTLPVVLALVFGAACDTNAAPTSDAEVLKKQAADKEAATQQAKEARAQQAKEAAAAREIEDKRLEAEYQAEKAKIEPFAKVPKKRPKGFANACTEMLAAYDVFMKQSLTGDAQVSWDADQGNRERTMRRACHLRPVDAVVCETSVLKRAAAGTAFPHIKRLCYDRFSE